MKKYGQRVNKLNFYDFHFAEKNIINIFEIDDVTAASIYFFSRQ